jgi:hypothetical protein
MFRVIQTTRPYKKRTPLSVQGYTNLHNFC